MFKLSISAALAAGVLLAGAVSAQDSIPFNGPMKYARLDMATGTLETFDTDPGPQAASPGDSTPVILFDNSNIGSSFSIGGGNAIVTNHHMAWGVADFGGMGATISEFRIKYVTGITAAQGTVAFRVRFYDGALGFGNQGTVNPNGDLLVTGLPESVSGGFEGWIVDITPLTPITMADGPIGWSYNSDASFTDGVNEVTGPFLAIAPVGPGVTANYDRYNEATNAYVNTFTFAAPNIGSFNMRLTGRTNAPPEPEPYVNYGTKGGVTFTGDGSATPGSTDNVLTIKSTNGKKAVLVAGITQSNITGTNLNLTFYAFPWLIQIDDLQLALINGSVDLPFTLPLSLLPGDKLYLQAFAQALNNQYTKFSDGIELTVQ